MRTENNKIIAEFLHGKNAVHANQYHENWNELMEVVEKIESLEYLNKNSTCESFDSFGIEINKNRCDITHYGDFTHHLLQGNGKTRIESVYNACVEFIKWYNEQNK